MPRPDHYPADIMDKCQAFSDALNAYLHLADRWQRGWERRYSPSQTRIPAGQPGGGQWTDGGGGVIPVVDREPMPEARATREALGSLPRDFDEGFGKPQDGEIGPPDKMRPDVPRVRAKDYARFKKLMGAAKEDHEYHHIVEQREIDKSPELDPKDEGALNGSENIVELPKNIHKCINKKMLTKNLETGKSPRDDNEGKSLKEKFGQGIQIMKECIAEEIAKLKPEDREKLRTPEKPKHPPEEEAPKKPDTLPEEEPIPLPPPRMTVPPIAPPSGGRTPGIIPSPGYKPGVGHPFFGRQWPPIAG